MIDPDEFQSWKKAVFMTEEEVASVLDIAIGTLRNRVYTGRNHPPVSPGRLYDRAEFAKWMKMNARKELYRAS